MKFRSLQSLRGLAANAVVLAHFSLLADKYTNGHSLLPEWTSFAGPIGVNAFFVISGCVMGLLLGRSRWLPFLSARIARIYPIYWVYTTLVLVVFLLKPEAVNSSYAHPASVLKSYLLWPDDVRPLLVVGWSLINEMYFYLTITLLLMTRTSAWIGLAAWASVILLAPLVAEVPDQSVAPVAALLLNPLTLLFILGAYVGLAIDSGLARGAGVCLTLGLILLPIGTYICIAQDPRAVALWPSTIFLGLPFPLIVYGIAGLEVSGKWPEFRLAEILGDASYSTYLGHVLVISVLWRASGVVQETHWIIECGLCALCILAANGFGYLSYRWLEKPMLNIIRPWLPGKAAR